MYLKSFEIRWNDLDANRHLANSAYISFMSHTRMSYLDQMGFSHKVMSELGIGPVVFYEHVYYLKEVLPGPPVRVSLEITGLSEDGMFFEFQHNFYDQQGKQLAYCELMGGWMDLKTRKLTPLEGEFLQRLTNFERAKGFRFLTKEDTRRFVIPRKDLV